MLKIHQSLANKVMGTAVQSMFMESKNQQQISVQHERERERPSKSFSTSKRSYALFLSPWVSSGREQQRLHLLHSTSFCSQLLPLQFSYFTSCQPHPKCSSVFKYAESSIINICLTDIKVRSVFFITSYCFS